MSQKWLEAAKKYHAASKTKPLTEHEQKVREQRRRDEQIQSGVLLISAFWDSCEAEAARKLLLQSEECIVICEDSMQAITLDSAGFNRVMKCEIMNIPMFKRVSFSEVVDSALQCGVQVDSIIPGIRTELDRIADAAPTNEP